MKASVSRTTRSTTPSPSGYSKLGRHMYDQKIELIGGRKMETFH